MGASREHCGGVLRVTHVCLRVRVLGVSLNAKLWLLGTQLEMQKCDDSLNPKRARREQFQQPGSGWDTIFPDGVLSCNPARMAWRHAPRTTWYVLQRLSTHVWAHRGSGSPTSYPGPGACAWPRTFAGLTGQRASGCWVS